MKDEKRPNKSKKYFVDVMSKLMMHFASDVAA